jgi:DNA-directed RNA polymerase specialized sigma24 family protein
MSFTSEEVGGIDLEVTTRDQGTEIVVVDGDLRPRAHGRGTLVANLPAGIYRLRVRAGGDLHEELITLREADGPVVRSYPERILRFACPAPVYETGTSHEYHQDIARAESGTVRVAAGEGSWIFVMVRTWTPPGTSPCRQNPARGFVLRDREGRLVADLAEASRVELFDETGGPAAPPGRDACAACTIAVAPGVYSLVRSASDGSLLAQTVVAVRGWQTQVFGLNLGSAAPSGDGFPAPAGVSIFMSGRRTDGSDIPRFDPEDPALRLSELARQGLIDGRQVLSDSAIDAVRHGRFDDPMLGLFTAYQLLLKRGAGERAAEGAGRDAAEAVLDILRHIRNLVGQDHPDAEALSLVREEEQGRHDFPVPPMLRPSWDLILDATVGWPDLIPRGSPAAAIAGRLLIDEPWLTWSRARAWADDRAALIDEALRDFMCRSGRVGRRVEDLQLDESQIRGLVRTLSIPRGHLEIRLKEYFLARKPVGLPSTEVSCRSVIGLYRRNPAGLLPPTLADRLAREPDAPFPDVFCSWFLADEATARINSVIRLNLGNRPISQDELNGVRDEVLLAAMQVIVGGTLKGHVPALMNRLAAHKSRLLSRSRGEPSATGLAAAMATAPPPQDWFKELGEALASLSPEKQQALRLSFLDGLEDAEVAERLGIARGELRSSKEAALEGLLDAMLRRHIGALSPDLDGVVRLYFEGHDEAKIAQQLNIALVEVRSRLTQARAIVASDAGLT